MLIIIFSCIGFCVAAYASFVERRVTQNASYKPWCDINDWVSCTKPAKSSYANIFFVSNARLGMLYYALVFFLALMPASKLLLLTTMCGCIGSVIFAYILYFKIKSLCLLCTVLYFINVVLLMLSLRNGA